MYKARMWIVLASVMLTVAGCREKKTVARNVVVVKTAVASAVTQTGQLRFSGTIEAESGTTQQLYRQCRDRYTDAYAALQTKLLEYRQSIGQ